MNDQRQQNSTNYPVQFVLYLTSDHITLATGKTPTVTLRKPGGGSFSAISGSVTEVGNGVYEISGNATDRNTLGENTYSVTASGCDPLVFAVDIIVDDAFSSNAAITTAITNLQSHGDSTWATAVITSLLTSSAFNTAMSNLQTHGDANWEGGTDLTPVLSELDLIKAKTDLITLNNFTVTSPNIPNTNDIQLVYGNDYTLTSGLPLPNWSSNDWTAFSLDTATSLTFETKTEGKVYSLTKNLILISPTSVSVELTHDDLTHFDPTISIAQVITWNREPMHTFSVKAILASGDRVTLVQGRIFIVEDVT